MVRIASTTESMTVRVLFLSFDSCNIVYGPSLSKIRALSLSSSDDLSNISAKQARYSVGSNPAPIGKGDLLSSTEGVKMTMTGCSCVTYLVNAMETRFI
ncbi:hypothetical protein Bca52824_004453 [Brassica carinata]|uniref:Uncharacterized protein n=1 Tax=Brassica carinata TaxID=52824 RepID=A0A8X7WLY7_BRACI|nr:hypothetical protein Bca52824_004453 [Brassica carinata]